MILVAIERAAAAVAKIRSSSANGAAAANGSSAEGAANGSSSSRSNGCLSPTSPREQQQAPHDVTFEVCMYVVEGYVLPL